MNVDIMSDFRSYLQILCLHLSNSLIIPHPIMHSSILTVQLKKRDRTPT